jgi:hypothetical protein
MAVLAHAPRPASAPMRASAVALAIAIALGAGVINDVPAGSTSASTATPLFGAGIALAGISCASPGNCTAVGNRGGSDQCSANWVCTARQQPIYATETNGTWGKATEVLAPGGNPAWTPSGGGGFSSVSCTTAADCTAVGEDGVLLDPGVLQETLPIVATETHGSWGTASEVESRAANLTEAFQSVSCTSPEDCTAGVGEGGAFNGISCAAAADCTAVGTRYIDNGLEETEMAGSWEPVKYIVAADDLFSISCASVGNCTAVGSDSNEPMYVTETAGEWDAGTSLPAPGGGTFYSVSCSSETDCAAVGSTLSDDGANDQPIVATESAGLWGPVTVMHSREDGGSLVSVSCPSATECVAVGTDGEGHALYPSETAGVWLTAPRAPTLKALRSTSRSITVTWSAPTSGPAVAVYTATASWGKHSFACATTSTSCTIHGLTNATTYLVSVTSRGPAGTSASSAKRRATPRRQRSRVPTDRKHLMVGLRSAASDRRHLEP